MKRAITSALVVLAIAAAITPTAFAIPLGTSTCATNSMHCVGSGGAAGR